MDEERKDILLPPADIEAEKARAEEEIGNKTNYELIFLFVFIIVVVMTILFDKHRVKVIDVFELFIETNRSHLNKFAIVFPSLFTEIRILSFEV